MNGPLSISARHRIRRFLAPLRHRVDQVPVKLIQQTDSELRSVSGLDSALVIIIRRVFILADVLELHLDAQLIRRPP